MSSSSTTIEEKKCNPDEKVETTENVVLPSRSKMKYERNYQRFMQWRSAKKINTFSEKVLLDYFAELSEKQKPSSLWAVYSMLKCCIQLKHQINLQDYSNLIDFLKRQAKGFKSTKSEVLSPDNIKKFLKEAPDEQYLAIKVALIFGVQGACRRHELSSITLKDIEDKEYMVLVRVPQINNEKHRLFVVYGEFYNIYKKYSKLRPPDAATDKFFLNYHRGKCTKHGIGINTFGSMPKTVATFLKLENAKNYTGHTFRRSFATILADTGVDLLALQGDPVEDNKGPSTSTSTTTLTSTSTSASTSAAAIATENEQQVTINHNIEGQENMEISEIQSNTLTNFHFNISNCSNISIYLDGKKQN